MIRHRRNRIRPIVERLDDRCLPSGLTPAQIATAYGLSGLTFGSQAANGSGQTIALVDAFNDPNIRTELSTFDAANNLPDPPSLTVVGQSGTGTLPANDVGWAQEEALDVEWAHAIAPGANIVLVEANSDSQQNLTAAVQTAQAIPGVTVVSMSWGGSEGFTAKASDGVFINPAVTFVAASGDDGFFGGAEWPAASPNVVAVGGTSLYVDAAGDYQGETAWFGTSGGFSRIEPEPTYQETVQSTGGRSTPDVAFDGDPNTGVEVYSMNAYNGQGSWTTVGGTSLSAASWAGVIAIVDQGRALAGSSSLSSEQTLTALYSLPSTDFHTLGGGYNTQTGLGSPNGAALINGLVTYNTATTSISQPVTSQPVTSQPVTSQPVTTQPVTNPPVISQPVTTHPVSKKPVTKTPVVKKHPKAHVKVTTRHKSIEEVR